MMLEVLGRLLLAAGYTASTSCGPLPMGETPPTVATASLPNCGRIVETKPASAPTATSETPAPLKSPVTTSSGLTPNVAAGVLLADAKVPSPLPSRIDAALSPGGGRIPVSAVVRSALPSPLKSPTAMDTGTRPV